MAKVNERVLVIVPAWNEEKNVGHTVAEILDADDRYDVIVVDDGSTDATVEVAKAVKAAAPKLMLGARLSVKEWVDGGFDVPEAIDVAKALKEAGVAYLCCSSGGNSPLQKLPTGAGYQVHLGEAVRKATGIATRTVGLITDPDYANTIVAQGKADIVALGRAFLADPRWGWRAAATLGEKIHPAPQLARAVTTMEHWLKDDD